MMVLGKSEQEALVTMKRLSRDLDYHLMVACVFPEDAVKRHQHYLEADLIIDEMTRLRDTLTNCTLADLVNIGEEETDA